MSKSIFLIILIYSLSFNVLAKPLGNLPEGVKYTINTINAELTQRYFGNGLINDDDFQELLSIDIQERLSDADLLADSTDPEAVRLDVFLDYKRQYSGDGVGARTNVITNPLYYYHIKLSKKTGEVLYEFESKIKTLRVFSLFTRGSELNKNFSIDLANALSASIDVVNKIISFTPNADGRLSLISVEDEKSKDNISRTIELWVEKKALDKPIVLESLTYIPKSESKKYLRLLKQSKSDPKKRVKIYKQIFLDWMVDVDLYNYIVTDVNERYNTKLAKGESSELAWAVKAVASSGLKRYQPFIANISETAEDARIAKHATQMHLKFSSFQYKAQIVHDVARLPVKLSWKEKQVTNMLSSSYSRLRKQAIREIRANSPKDKTMLNKLSAILTEESPNKSFSITQDEDFYAWCARLLGSSGHKEYLPVLEKVQEEASSKKVQKFAKKFAKVLKKS